MANKNPIVSITMENGDVMKAELYPEIAPNTVNNFISLVKNGFYDGLIFHRVINGFTIGFLFAIIMISFCKKYCFSLWALL